MIKQLFVAIALVIADIGSIPMVWAAKSSYPLDLAPPRQSDMVALQNGARLFVNFCMSCHSANVMRYDRLVGLGLTEDQIKKNLMFTTDKLGDLMTAAMHRRDAQAWLGTAAPDLSVMARAKSTNAVSSGADYIYTYLRTFYRDVSRPSGWNNLVFPGVTMPHAMWAEQGPRELSTTAMHRQPAIGDGQPGCWERVTTTTDAQGYTQVKREYVPHHNNQAGVSYQFKAMQPQLSAAYDRDMADLTGFLTWMADPGQLERRRLGSYVLLFLGLFFMAAWRLNASYWKHVR